MNILFLASLWQNQGAMAAKLSYSKRGNRPKTVLNAESLKSLAIFYVGRYAVSCGRLVRYLERKLAERGWEGPKPNVLELADRFVELGYINDASFAMMKAEGLVRRGYGKNRVSGALHMHDIAEEDAAPALSHAAENGLVAALRLARRKRIGPYALAEPDPTARQKAFAAMMRAGHRLDDVKAVFALDREGADAHLEKHD